MRTETPRAPIRPEPDKGEGEGGVRIVGEVAGLAPQGAARCGAAPPPHVVGEAHPAPRPPEEGAEPNAHLGDAHLAGGCRRDWNPTQKKGGRGARRREKGGRTWQPPGIQPQPRAGSVLGQTSDITGQRCLHRTGEGLGRGQRPGGVAGEPEALDRPASGNQGSAVSPLPLVASHLGLKGKAVNSSAVCPR